MQKWYLQNLQYKVLLLINRILKNPTISLYLRVHEDSASVVICLMFKTWKNDSPQNFKNDLELSVMSFSEQVGFFRLDVATRHSYIVSFAL